MRFKEALCKGEARSNWNDIVGYPLEKERWLKKVSLSL
jgi:hypothetical protein